MRYFRINLGYDKHISIDEEDLAKAISAQITGGVAVLKGYTVNGNHISLIEPDFHKAMGWNPGYKMVAEDENFISQKGIRKEYQTCISDVKEEVKARLEGRESVKLDPHSSIKIEGKSALLEGMKV